MGNKIQATVIKNLTAPVPPAEESRKSKINSDWVPFFKNSDNTFINDLAKRANQSSTHRAILNSKITYIIGDGIMFSNKDGSDYNGKYDDKIREVNGRGESLLSVIKKIAYDYVTFGNAYYNLVKTADTYTLFHTDATTVRLKVADEKGFINGAYISRYWNEIKLNNQSGDRPVTGVDVYSSTNKSAKESLIHIKQYSPENYYYGLPDYIGCLEWIDIEYQIPKFNLDLFKNGFFPSALIQLYGDTPEGFNTPTDYLEHFVDRFTGEGNNNKIMAQLLDEGTTPANVQLFDGVKEGHFKLQDELAVQRIISAHRWYPELSGILIPGKLGGSENISNSYEIAMNTVINVYKQDILEPLNNIILPLLGMNDVTIDLTILNPISMSNKINPEMALTIDEYREEIGRKPLEEGGEDKLVANVIKGNGANTNDKAA